MGIINAGTAVGAVVAPPLIVLVLTACRWFGLAPWRWVFFLTGGLGLLWTLWWWRSYRPPDRPQPTGGTRSARRSAGRSRSPDLLRHRETWAVVGAKFLSDGAWYFYLFWLPKYLVRRLSTRPQDGRRHRLDSLRGFGRRLPGGRRAFELAADARHVR